MQRRRVLVPHTHHVSRELAPCLPFAFVELVDPGVGFALAFSLPLWPAGLETNTHIFVIRIRTRASGPFTLL